MNLKTVMALAIAAAFAAPVLAQQAPRPMDDKAANPTAGPLAGGFAAMDRNGDGYISRDEARDATWSNRFSELDKDNDARLSLSEFEAMKEGSAAGDTGASTSGAGDKPGQKQ